MKVTSIHSWCMVVLLAMSAIAVEAQDVVIRRPTKPTKTTTSKTSSSTNKPSRSNPKSKPEPANSIGTLSFETFTANGVSFKMVRVEGQGNPFYIGETEVTQGLWEAVMGSNPSEFKGNNRPIENVSWSDCKTFISKLNSLTGKNFRLPKESEWEYAAKGGNKSRGYEYSGSNTMDEVGWYYENSGNSRLDDSNFDYDDLIKSNCRTHPVKTKRANEIGLYDMNGNVEEWCEDLYDSSNSKRVVRGGGWIHEAYRCTMRGYASPDFKGSNLGLRLAL